MINLSKLALFINGKESKTTYLVVAKDTIYFLNKDVTKKTVNRLAKELNLDTRRNDDFNFYSFISELSERPDIIAGEYDPNTKILIISANSDETFMPSSHLLRNVVKQLGIRRVDYQSTNDDQELISSFYNDTNLGVNDFTGKIPDIMYHGTSSSHATSISRTGVVPNTKSNYSVHHFDKIFLTSQFNKAAYHASNACKQPGAFPVIFEVKIPDKNLLIPDFDVEDSVPEHLRTKNYESNFPSFTNRTKQERDPFSISKDYGIFGYKGRIPASFITKIYICDNANNDMISVSPDNWYSVNKEQLFSAIEYGGAEFYNQYIFCPECGNEKQNCTCKKCPNCNKIEYECSCDQTKWSMNLEKSKPLIKTANTTLLNNQKRFEIEISDTDRYTSDKYEIVLALTHTIRGHSLGLQINSAQLGVANYVEYWHYDEDQKSLANKTFDKIKIKLLETAKNVQFNCPPLATILPIFRYALRDTDIEHKEKSGVQLYNEYLRMQDKVEDYRTSIYGNRFNTIELSYLGEKWINSDDVSKQIEINEKGRKKRFYYKQASISDFFKDAEVLAMNEKFASWINLPKNLVIPFLTWLSLNYGILPAQAQDIATTQPSQIQQKVEEFKETQETPTSQPSQKQQSHYSDKFNKCLNITLKFEGGYSNNPNDKGKETNFGITTNTYKNYLNENKINKPSNVKAITQQEVEEIYHNMFWVPIQGEQLPDPVAIILFDYAVHSGPQKAIKSLQKVVGAKQTGHMDKNIISKINQCDQVKVAQSILKERQNFLSKITSRNKQNKVFSKGWNSRCESIGKLIAPQQPKNQPKKKMPILPNSLKQRCENIPEKWNYNFSQQVQLFT